MGCGHRLRAVKAFRQTEIGDLGAERGGSFGHGREPNAAFELSIFGWFGFTPEQDIRRLQVAVHDSATMRFVDGFGQNLDEPGGLQGWLGLADEPGFQRAVRHVLHREERTARDAVDFVDLDQVRMLQARDDLGLGTEAIERALCLRALGKHLDRHHTFEPSLTSQVDDSHASPAQLAQEGVTGNGRKLVVFGQFGRRPQIAAAGLDSQGRLIGLPGGSSATRA